MGNIRKLYNRPVHNITVGRDCLENSSKLTKLLLFIHDTDADQYQYTKLLKDFAHSASCPKIDCTPVCLMFRRIRRHIRRYYHPNPSYYTPTGGECCYMSGIYSLLLRQHVFKCQDLNCGLPNCKSLQTNLLNLQRSLDISRSSG